MGIRIAKDILVNLIQGLPDMGAVEMQLGNCIKSFTISTTYKNENVPLVLVCNQIHCTFIELKILFHLNYH